jgi:phytoene synthase
MRGKAARRLAEARTRLLDVPSVARPAFLPIALVDVYLARMERADYQPFHTRIEVPQWRRQWALWRAAHALKNDAAADPSD